MSAVELVVDAEGVARLRMLDAEGGNAFRPCFVEELRAALRELADPAVRVAVISGLDELFSSGGDRDTLIELAEGRRSPYDLELTRDLLNVPVPTIGALEGHAVGGGLVFGLSCDMVVLARESRYGCNFMEMGFTPGMGATGLLRASLGEAFAAELMYSARYVRGADFLGRSLVNDVLPRAEVLPRALDLARRIAEKPRYALCLLKRGLARSRRAAFEEAHEREALMHGLCFSRPETRERIRSQFLEATEGGR